jgi:hypothetical protein
MRENAFKFCSACRYLMTRVLSRSVPIRLLKLFSVFLQNNQLIYPHQNGWLGWLISQPDNMPVLFYGMKLAQLCTSCAVHPPKILWSQAYEPFFQLMAFKDESALSNDSAFYITQR